MPLVLINRPECELSHAHCKRRSSRSAALSATSTQARGAIEPTPAGLECTGDRLGLTIDGCPPDIDMWVTGGIPTARSVDGNMETCVIGNRTNDSMRG